MAFTFFRSGRRDVTFRFLSEAEQAAAVERVAGRERQVREERPLVGEESQQGRQ